MICPKCTAKIPDGEHICKNCQTDVYTHHVKIEKERNTAVPMAWFNFLIYFALFANAALNTSMASYYATGFIHTGSNGWDYAEEVYSKYAAMQTIDVVMAVLCVVLAVFCIFVRFRLARFKKDGPILLMVMYIFSTVINTFYLIFVSSIGVASTSENGVSMTNMSGILITLGTSIALCIANYIYFNNRKEMFKN